MTSNDFATNCRLQIITSMTSINNYSEFTVKSRTKRNSSGDRIANVNFFYDDIVYTYYKIRKLRHNWSGSFHKFHHSKIRLQSNLKIILSNYYCNIQQLICDRLRITLSFSVISANIAINDIALKLHSFGYISAAESIGVSSTHVTRPRMLPN